jgi:hypothetical protein
MVRVPVTKAIGAGALLLFVWGAWTVYRSAPPPAELTRGVPVTGPGGSSLSATTDPAAVFQPKNRDEFEQKTTKITKRTTCASKPTHLLGEAIRGTFFYGSALFCVLCALLFNFAFSRLGSKSLLASSRT